MLALPVTNNTPGNHILDEVFVHHFLTEENNNYEDLLKVIKNRYPNLSVKRFSSCHGIKKRRSVADRTVDIRLVLNEDCRLKTVDWGKIQTEGKNADCRPGVKMQTVDFLTESCYRFHY